MTLLGGRCGDFDMVVDPLWMRVRFAFVNTWPEVFVDASSAVLEGVRFCSSRDGVWAPVTLEKHLIIFVKSFPPVTLKKHLKIFKDGFRRVTLETHLKIFKEGFPRVTFHVKVK